MEDVLFPTSSHVEKLFKEEITSIIMGEKIDYSEVRTENKWKILRAQWRFALWAIYSSLGSVMLGFDFVVGGQVLAMPAFQQQYGIPWPSEPSGYLVPAIWQSAWNGASSGGDAIGCIIAGVLMGIIGRKHLILLGSGFNAIGIGMQQASTEWKLFFGGRLMNAIGFGMVFTFSPVWIGEVVRPELRGFFLCILNGSIVLGQFLVVLISRGTSEIVGKWSYMSLIVLQYLFPAILILIYPFFPESAYFLIKKGKYEEARKALNRTHGSSDQDLINVEMKRIEQNVHFSEELAKAAAIDGPLAWQCWRKTNRRRTLTAMMPAAAQQLIGAAFVLGYVTYFLSLIGITQYFTVSCVLFTIMLLSNLAAFPLIEIIGRRTLIVPGMVLLTLVNLVIGIMGSVNNTAAQWVIVVFIFLWAIFYQMSIGPCGFALASEVSSLPLRAQTQAYIGLTQTTVGWVIGFVTPYIINPDAGNLGGKIGYVFFGLGVINCIFLYFFCPETKGLAYDEIDYLFSTKTSSRRFPETIARYREGQGGDLTVKIGEKAVSTHVDSDVVNA